jgi:hypothetical protein
MAQSNAGENDATSRASPPAARPTLLQALLVLVGVIVAVAAYLALSTALGLREAYIGFIFVFYWMSLEQGKLQRVPAILLGLCFGLAAAWLLQYATHPLQPALLGLFLLAVSVSIVALVLGRAPLVFNIPAMLALTVFTIPYIQQGANFAGLFVALGFAAVLFVGLIGGLTRLSARARPS